MNSGITLVWRNVTCAGLRYTVQKYLLRDMVKSASRRSFMKLGLMGAITLAAAGGAYRLIKGPSAAHGFILDDTAKLALGAIAAAILRGAAEDSPEFRKQAVARTQIAISGLTLTTQNEVSDLFGLLCLGPTRRLVAELPDDWASVKTDDVAKFLQDWRSSRFALLQTGYQALHDLVIGAWYGDSSTWAAIGYPGPLKELSE